jgi:hypothetical protein
VLGNPLRVCRCSVKEPVPTAYPWLAKRLKALFGVGGEYIERRFKEPIEGFRAVFVSEEPAWLCGFEYDDGKDGKPVRMIFSKPRSLKEVPPGVFERLKGIEFKKSDQSIRRHMVYL